VPGNLPGIHHGLDLCWHFDFPFLFPGTPGTS
jgi:hypothetical protein